MKYNHLSKDHLCPIYNCNEVVPGGKFACYLHRKMIGYDTNDNIEYLMCVDKIGAIEDYIDRILEEYKPRKGST